MTRVSIQDKVTRTSAANGSSIDISAITTDWTITIEIMAVATGVTGMRFALEDSVDAFTAKLPGPAFSHPGGLLTAYNTPFKFTVTKAEFNTLRFGTGSAVLRLALAQITGSGLSVTYQAYLEY